MLCIYHVADNDGKGSGAIIRTVYPGIELMGLNHDMEIPYDEIRKQDKVIVCDFALPVDFMFELNEKIDFTWIDHHASVINEYNAKLATGKYKEIKGLRRIGTAAIVLTWEYYYPDKPIPEGVILLGKNDVFDLQDDRVRPFEYAFQAKGVNKPTDEIWDKLFDGRLNVANTVEKGRAILDWIRVRNYRLVRSMGFESEYKGMKCVCANMAQGYSEFFDSLENIQEYDFMVNFFMNKRNRWNLSFYSDKENIDVSKIAAEFGGGGHIHAAGASNLLELPKFLSKKYD